MHSRIDQAGGTKTNGNQLPLGQVFVGQVALLNGASLSFEISNLDIYERKKCTFEHLNLLKILFHLKQAMHNVDSKQWDAIMCTNNNKRASGFLFAQVQS